MNTFPANRSLEATFIPQDTLENIPFEIEQQTTALQLFNGTILSLHEDDSIKSISLENMDSNTYNDYESFTDSITSKGNCFIKSTFISCLKFFRRDTLYGSMTLLVIFVAFALCFLMTVIFLNSIFDSRTGVLGEPKRQKNSLLVLLKFISASFVLSNVMIISNLLLWVHESQMIQVSFSQIFFANAFTFQTLFICLFCFACFMLISLRYRKYQEYKKTIAPYSSDDSLFIRAFSHILVSTQSTTVLLALTVLFMLFGYLFTISNVAYLCICFLVQSAIGLLHVIIKECVQNDLEIKKFEEELAPYSFQIANEQ